MRIGTKSVLFGAHAFWLHPWFVALAWWKLFGFRRVPMRNVPSRTTSLLDPRLWFAFFVHDIGYLGKPNMDGEQGEQHPLVGAEIMTYLFDPWSRGRTLRSTPRYRHPSLGQWGEFVYFHSRFLSKRFGQQFSTLCVADKLATTLEPWWLYLPRVMLTGEIKEYMGHRRATGGKFGAPIAAASATPREWHLRMSTFCRDWAYEHRDGRRDTWTPEASE